MEIYDINDNLIENPDLENGYLKNDKKTIHHDAVNAIEEKFHYETLAEYPNGGKSVKKVIDIEGVEPKDAYNEEINIQRYILFTEDELKEQLKRQKEYKIAQSKQDLKTYLANNPMQWLDGNYYSVTEEKQNQLNSNLALYQLSVASGSPRTLEWNCTGETCTKWTLENLTALALAIGNYVQPIVAQQRKIEVEIRNCTTKEELNSIKIKYE